jgi:hypothetical protein
VPEVAAVVNDVTMRGGQGSITWGYRTAADIVSWRVSRKAGKWKLVARPKRIDSYQVTQTPLLFVAPRMGGFWTWPIEKLTVGAESLVAELGPPEQ